MPRARPWLTAVSTALILLAPPIRSAEAAVIGQPLDYAVRLRLEPGTQLASDCLRAEVAFGSRRLAAEQVRSSVEPAGANAARVRVQTLARIDEPTVELQLVSSCSARFSRRYVLLAEAAAANGPATGSAPAAAGAPGGAQMGAAPAPPERARGPAARREGAAAAPRVPPPPRESGGARLRLDRADPAPALNAAEVVEAAIVAVAEAASAARAHAAAASQAATRIAALERDVQRLRGDNSRQQAEAGVLRQRLAAAETAGRWTLPLLALAALLAGVAGWLAWRLHAQGLQLRRRWHEMSSSAPGGTGGSQPADDVAAAPGSVPAARVATAPTPFITAPLPVAAAAARSAAHAWPKPAPAEPPLPAPSPRSLEDTDPGMQRTELLPPQVGRDAPPPHAVAIEELIDIEQQADFFLALGQEDAAIDLLVDHLQGLGSASPLPYLKLLEIYQRRGDPGAYEALRQRFNHQFNAYAPQWDETLAGGRSLEDYPGVLPRLQQVWARPLDAMAELEALLYRRVRADLFDLPAYREILFLYALARDLLDREPVDTADVDLLLPLADGSQGGSTLPMPLDDVTGSAPPRTDERPTRPMNLDFRHSESDAASLFDPPQGREPRR